MSIIVPDDEINIEIPDSSSIKPPLKQLPKQAHIISRNIRRNSLSNSNSQYSTKEGTPNKEGKVESKTIETRNLNQELENVSSESSKDKLSNITQILNQNNYNYSHVKDKSTLILLIHLIVPSCQGDSNQFVYNMIYTTNSAISTTRTDEITKRLNDLKKPPQPQLKTEPDKAYVLPKKHSNKEKISCCFFFHR